MRALNSQAKPSHYIALVIWLVFIIGAAVYLIGRELSSFDPNAILSKASPEKLVESIDLSLGDGTQLEKTLIHISDEACHCNRYTQKHQLAINKLADTKNFSIQHVSVNELQESTYIPSTPAVMLVGENNELIYFGPYAQGIACSENNTMLELSWKNYLKGYNANIIFSEAEGCYCNRQRT